MNSTNDKWFRRFGAKATTLVVGRALHFRGDLMLIGAPDSLPSDPHAQDRDKAAQVANDVLEADHLLELVPTIGDMLAAHLAMQRELELQQGEIAARAERLRVRIKDLVGPLGAEQRRWLELQLGGLPSTPIQVILGRGECVSVSPFTSDGRTHSDLLALTAFRLHDVLKQNGVRGKLDDAGRPSITDLPADLLGRLLERPLDPDYLRQKVSALRWSLDLERTRQTPLFAIDAEQVLDTVVPWSDDPFDPCPTYVEVFRMIPGFSSAVRRPPQERPVAHVDPKPVLSTDGKAPFRVPMGYLPWIEKHARWLQAPLGAQVPDGLFLEVDRGPENCK